VGSVIQRSRDRQRALGPRERPGHSLQPTALVNEAYLRLIDLRRVRWQDRAHFFAMSARLMRRVLVDAARAKASHKRGGGAQRVTFAEELLPDSAPTQDVIALDDALTAGPVREQPHRVLARKALVTAHRSAPGGAAPFAATRADLWIRGARRRARARHGAGRGEDAR